MQSALARTKIDTEVTQPAAAGGRDPCRTAEGRPPAEGLRVSGTPASPSGIPTVLLLATSLFGDVAAALREHGSATLTDCPATAITVTHCDVRDNSEVRYPPICTDGGRNPIEALAAQICEFCAPRRRRQGSLIHRCGFARRAGVTPAARLRRRRPAAWKLHGVITLP